VPYKFYHRRIQTALTEAEKDLILAAKLRLMAVYGLDEVKAYHFIRRVAMDNKATRVEIAIRILKEA
jgi:AmiR/NasT family two-component response regulator